MGIKALRKVQLGGETTAGTAVAADTIYRVENAMLKDDRVKVAPGEDVGNLGGLNRQYESFLGGSLSMPEHPLNFEQSLHVFEAGIKAVQTPSADTGGSGKIYVYPFPTTSVNTPKTYTIEGGDDQQAEEMEFAFVKSFTISGGPKEALMLSAEWEGRQVAPTTFTAGLSAPSVEEVLFSKGEIYIDDVGGTLGATKKSNTLMGMTLNVTTGFQSVPAACGQKYFAFVKQTKPEVTLNVTFEHDASAVAEIAAWRAGTARQIRLLFVGSSLTTAGATYSAKSFIVDLAGKWESFDAIGETDGNDIVSGTFRAGFDSTANLFGNITVVNELAAVP